MTLKHKNPFFCKCTIQPNMPAPPRRILVAIYVADIFHHADISSSPDACVNLMEMNPDGSVEGFKYIF